MTESGSTPSPHVRVVDRNGSGTDRTPLSLGSPNVGVASAREAQNETDPMRRIWNALHDAGCKPHGDTHQFRSFCPIHNGQNSEALSVGEGSDGRVLMRCFANDCDKRAIVGALGLSLGDLFPAGHRKATHRRAERAVKPRPITPGAALLDLLTAGGFTWKAHLLGTRCPFCDNPHAYLTVHDAGGLDVDCEGCTADEVRRAVETRAAIAERGVTL